VQKARTQAAAVQTLKAVAIGEIKPTREEFDAAVEASGVLANPEVHAT
jgi:hypothetical protein